MSLTPFSAEKLKQALIAALDSGIRHIDSAQMYSNEDTSGVALTQWFSQNPNVSRSDLFITSKVG